MLDSDLKADLSAAAAETVALRFSKMQALGNDFVVVSLEDLSRALESLSLNHQGLTENQELLAAIARFLCDRHFGIGADGFILVAPGSRPDRLSWVYINSDGSSSLMCGNGLRCLALFAEMRALAPASNYLVETGKGPVEIRFKAAGSITTDLGEAILQPDLVPVKLDGDLHSITQILAYPYKLESGQTISITALSMGNPHCVIFVESFDFEKLEKIALELQASSFFPEGVNVEFVQVLSRKKVSVLVYERGCGRTLACASGAAACAVAACMENRCDELISVELEGGLLELDYSQPDKHVRITGPAAFVFDGIIDLSSCLASFRSEAKSRP